MRMIIKIINYFKHKQIKMNWKIVNVLVVQKTIIILTLCV